jgi:hypothetical protein
MEILEIKKMPKGGIQCCCGKVYTQYSGLWKHKKKCQVSLDNEYEGVKPSGDGSFSESSIDNFAPQMDMANLTMILINTVKQNQELQKQTQELQKQSYEYQMQNQEFQQKMFEMMKDTVGTHNTMINSNNTSNTTNNNNKFNLNFFLNETCKDAMNIKEFIDSLTVSFDDVEYSGIYGFTEGMSRIFVRELNKLDVCKRPIHCSDVKREVFHIKDENNSWENERHLMFKMINLIIRKNMFILKDWSEANPQCMDTQTAIHDRFVKLQIACIGPYDNEVEEKEFNKIISKVAKATMIDKSKRGKATA